MRIEDRDIEGRFEEIMKRRTYVARGLGNIDQIHLES
jgi:hypothetical protein